MIMKAPISFCLIVKNEPLLEKCLLSIREYIEEIVVVDTGSTDGITQTIGRKYADIFEVYTACNNSETGLIEDFSQARQHSFNLGTKPFVGWCDADDQITGAENLYRITEEFLASNHGLDGCSWIFPYEYSYNEQGQCTLKHYRERLFFNHKCFKWVNPVHEVVIPQDGFKVSMVTREEVIWKHHRQFSTKVHESGRNLRILRKYYEKVGDSDARQLYYLGLECANMGHLEESINFLTKYISVSGWEDERVMACLKLVEIFQGINQLEEGLKWAFKAVEIKENWGEGYFALARMFYFLAMRGGPGEYRNWERCAYFAKIGLKLPPTSTLLFINPLDRELEIHKYLNMALNKMGDVNGALDSVKQGMEKHPKDPHFLNNRRLYEDFIARHNIMENINVLKTNNSINQLASDQVQAIINNANIPGMMPIPLPAKENKSESLSKVEVVKDAPLDIVFYAGDGMEIWNPETIKKVGQGGSEIAMAEQAKGLASLGHRVRVYNSCGQDATYDNVHYYTTNKYRNLQCDVLVVSRQTPALGNEYNIQAKLKLLWVHDVYAINASPELLAIADRILALSDWHRHNIINHHQISPHQVIQTRNGVDLARFNKQIIRNPFKCVNSSSPDRSWPVLLSIWPEIKQQVKQAELHLYYGFKNWEIVAQHDKLQMDLINRLKQQIKELEPLGVVYHDRINQNQLAEEFLSAGCWLYSNWFFESSCISSMEAQAAGLRMIASNNAALKETAGSRATLIDGEWTSQEYQKKFIQATVMALTNPNNSDREELQKYAKNNFSWTSLAKDWEQMFYQLLKNKNAEIKFQ
jgi:glycosyltransferase involved in cell wall biosynthesis